MNNINSTYTCPNYQTSEYMLYSSSRTFILSDTPYPHQLKHPAFYSEAVSQCYSVYSRYMGVWDDAQCIL